MHKTETIIETPRLILRRYRMTDFNDYWEYISQPNVGPMCGWGPYRSKKEAMDRLALETRKSLQFAIVYKAKNKVIGAIELRNFQRVNYRPVKLSRKSKEMGYLLNEKYWGKGIMPEAMKGLLEHAFITLEIPEIVITHAEANVQSGRVQEKLGFSVIGRKINSMTWVDGQLTAKIQRMLTREEYIERYLRTPQAEIYQPKHNFIS